MPSTFSSSNCCSGDSTKNIIDDISLLTSDAAKSIGYNVKELESIPESSVLGVGCGNPIKFAHIKEGDTVVDFGSGARIDVFFWLLTLSRKEEK